jgi:hypothetical protein
MTGPRRHRIILAVAGSLAGVFALGGVLLLWNDRETVGDNLTTIEVMVAEQNDVIDQLSKDSDELRQQLLDMGVKPSAPAPEKRTDELGNLPAVPRAGTPIPPTDAQVGSAVTVVLENNPDLLTPQVIAEVSRQLAANPPPAGEPGADATDAQVFSAVVAFCTDPDEPCRGEDGTDAVLTQEAVNLALADFCGTNPDACQSTIPGPAGQTGDTGSSGRGLVSIDCVDDVLVATYDQEPLTQTIEGSACQFPPGQDGNKEQP